MLSVETCQTRGLGKWVWLDEWVGLIRCLCVCRYLGTRAVKLFRVRMQESECVLCVSSRSWLSYSFQSRFHLTPLSYDVLEFASGFSSEQCPEGIVAIAGNTLRILSLEKLGVIFNQVATPLQYTPRKLAVHPPTGVCGGRGLCKIDVTTMCTWWCRLFGVHRDGSQHIHGVGEGTEEAADGGGDGADCGRV